MRKIIYTLIFIVAILFVVPLVFVKLIVSPDAGLLLLLSLYFIVNPLASVACGIYSGIDIKKMWFVPIVFALAFLISNWIIFDMGEIVFVVYSLIYAVICSIAMLATYLIKCIVKRNKN